MAKILVKNSVTSGSSPAGLSLGEIAVNITDKKIFFGNAVESAVAVYDRNAHVLSFNGSTGAVGITSGKNINLTQSGQTLTIGISAAQPGTTGTIQFNDGSGGLSASTLFTYTSGTLRVGGASRYLTLYNTAGYNVLANNGSAILCLTAPGSQAAMGDPLSGASGTYIMADSSAADTVTINAATTSLIRSSATISASNDTGYLKMQTIGGLFTSTGVPTIVIQDADTDFGGIPSIEINPSSIGVANALYLGTAGTNTTVRGTSVTFTPRSTHSGGITTTNLFVSSGATFIGNISAPNIVNSVNGITGPVGITAGSNITITLSGKTLTIASTASGGGAGFTYASSAPVSPSIGDRWIDSDTGKEYVYVNDGSSSQWMEPVSSNGLVGVTYTSATNFLEFGVTGSFVKLGINNTSPQYTLDVNGIINAPVGISAGPVTAAGATFSGAVTSDGGFRISSGAINAQTGTTYSLLSTDNGKVITWSNASGVTLTVPSGLPVGFNATIIQIGAGSVGITGSGVTLNSFEGKLRLAGQHAAVTIISYSSNIFNVAGGLTA